MNGPTKVPSGELSTNTVLDTGRGTFNGLNIATGTVEVYDGQDNTGKLLFKGSTGIEFNPGVRYTEGLYVDVETGTATAVVYYGA